jgi:hypothetical protein
MSLRMPSDILLPSPREQLGAERIERLNASRSPLSGVIARVSRTISLILVAGARNAIARASRQSSSGS